MKQGTPIPEELLYVVQNYTIHSTIRPDRKLVPFFVALARFQPCDLVFFALRNVITDLFECENIDELEERRRMLDYDSTSDIVAGLLNDLAATVLPSPEKGILLKAFTGLMEVNRMYLGVETDDVEALCARAALSNATHGHYTLLHRVTKYTARVHVHRDSFLPIVEAIDVFWAAEKNSSELLSYFLQSVVRYFVPEESEEQSLDEYPETEELASFLANFFPRILNATCVAWQCCPSDR